MPLAVPRSEVGNSSGPYTPRAGISAAVTMLLTMAQSHIGAPDAK